MAKTKIIKKSVWCHYIFLPHIIICLSQCMWVYPVNFTSDCHREGDGSSLGSTPRQDKDVKNGSYCCCVRCTTLIVRVGRNALVQKLVQIITMHSRTSR